MKKIVFLHSVNGLVEMFNKLCAELIPEAKLCHISDEGLIQSVLAAGGITPWIQQRVCDHAVAAERYGATVIQVTCSSLSPCVEAARSMVSAPVLKIDEPMAEYAVAHFNRIGIITTAPTTLRPSTALVQDQVRISRRAATVESVLCEGAYDAFFTGDLARHDEIVRHHLRDLMKRVEVVLLAQVSMVRVADTLDEKEKTVPILSSPRLAVERLATVLAGPMPAGK